MIMNRFWEGIIKPIIEGLNPTTIIEIGVDKGDNTRNILKYCSKSNCKLISIDPFPDECVNELESEYGNNFFLIRDLSLNVLSNIEKAQVIFIDGDHNWYTVYHELISIQNKNERYFPLVFLHDIEWPYGKRDMYYNPDNIPSEYIQEYNRKGIKLGSDELIEGINQDLNNALKSGTPKNGVLTAVLDFLDQTNYNLNFIKIPGFHGLGIIYDKNTYRTNNDFKISIDNIQTCRDYFEKYMALLSYSYYDLLNKNALLYSKEHEYNILKNENRVLNNKIKDLMNNEKLLYENIRVKRAKLKKNEIKLNFFESKLKLLSKSKKGDLTKNFHILFSKYSPKTFPKKSKTIHLSKIPYLYIFLKSGINLKELFMNIKGYRKIKNKQLFDEKYYLTKYPAVLISGINPLLHYLYYGHKEKKNPNSYFNNNYYLSKYQDVKKSKMNPLVHYALYGMNEGRKTNNKISVVVTSYNHEKYIEECMNSILMQKGDFELEIIVGDDDSKDNTRKILESYQKKHPNIIKLLPLTKNIGVTKNLKRCFKEVTGRYMAICEGDDYWTDEYKLQKQTDFLDNKKECGFCFNAFLMFYENNTDQNYVFQEKLNKDTFSTKELVLNNFIGNFSACMYRNDVIKSLPDELYEIFTVDWMFNIVNSEYGKIGFINEVMSVYRLHEQGLWSSKTSPNKRSALFKLIETYDKFLSFKYNSEFNEYKKRITINSDKSQLKIDLMDLIILDDVFPHPLSAFRMQEYNSYLNHFNKVKIYSDARAFPALNEKKSLQTIIKYYEKEYPQFKNKTQKFDTEIPLNAKLIYTIFLNNAYFFLDIIEKNGLPFVFTLYPGGGLQLNDVDSDKKLKKILSSPYFKKVIVTQKITYDYLVDNNFCNPDQIEEIFGVVTPVKLLEKQYKKKTFFGFNKTNLDICFVAHKYSEKGLDKGYDVFIEVAHTLVNKYSNIYFHVVGGFDEYTIDICSIKDRISFYGPQVSEWFDKFYKDKDLILSPNIPFKLKKGAFDGFPTGCCTDAGLHKVAMFCTDELNLNTKFENGKEIIIIPHDAQKITQIIEKYYHNPTELRNISETGYLKLKYIYSSENQIKPRITILKDLINGR